MRALRSLLEDCCGWNRKLWADALEYAVSALPGDIAGKTALEIGASQRSSVAPAFASQGANAVCSYYGQTAEELERGQLGFVVRKYGLERIPVIELDINELEGSYDIIVLKSVLGGLCRGNDYEKLGRTVDRLLGHVAENGFLISLDNGYVGLFQRFRSLRGAGRNNWTYFTSEAMLASLARHNPRIRGFGFLNFGTASLLFKRNLETVNDAMYLLDKVIVPIFEPAHSAVLATVISKAQSP